jgi:hypothetical protein
MQAQMLYIFLSGGGPLLPLEAIIRMTVHAAVHVSRKPCSSNILLLWLFIGIASKNEDDKGPNV